MMKIPAQHNTTNPPGQIVNPVPKQECEKLTFEEWSETLKDDIENIDFHYHGLIWEYLERTWKAAQENK